jgi:hypothetical protein
LMHSNKKDESKKGFEFCFECYCNNNCDDPTKLLVCVCVQFQ